MGKIEKILILSTSNPYKTAGVVAYGLFKGFLDSGFNTKLIVKSYDVYEPNIVCIDSKFRVLTIKIIRKLKKIFSCSKNGITLIEKYSFQDLHYTKEKYTASKILKRAKIKPDVIIVFFTQNFLNYKTLFDLQQDTMAPIIWQFADMVPFTGGCHFSWNCEGYLNTCGMCPALLSKNSYDMSFKNMIFKKELIEKLDITAAIGSDWLINKARESFLFKNKRIEKIFLCMDSNVFFPVSDNEKRKIRRNNGVPENSLVFLIMANYLSHERKGIKLIMDSLNKIPIDNNKTKNIHLVILGNEFGEIKESMPDFLNYNYFGTIERSSLPIYYQLSDFYLSASIQDVGPYTIVESLMCGVPVISFDTGFANDFVIEEKTGYLIKNISSNGFANGILSALGMNYNDYQKMCKYAVSRTKTLLKAENQIIAYKKLIGKLIKDRN